MLSMIGEVEMCQQQLFRPVEETWIADRDGEGDHHNEERLDSLFICRVKRLLLGPE
jgi:hypothetical protein